MATVRPDRGRARFDGFEIDLASGELRKNDGTANRIQPKPLQLLRLLLESEGKVVTRDRLREVLWSDQTFVDFEHGVNTAVKKLRQALDDSVESPRYIQTLPKIGYRFLPAVQWIGGSSVSASSLPEEKIPSKANTRPRWNLIARMTLAIVAAVVALVVFVYLAQRKEIGTPTPGASERRLTANPDDTPVMSGVISPDGKYLAYSDATGLYLRDVDTGETHPVPLPEGFDALVESWFPDSTHLLVSRVENSVQAPGLWIASVMGGAPRRILEEGSLGVVSPDGARIAFSRQNGLAQEIWVSRSNGEDPQRLISSIEDQLSRVAWAPDSNRFAYVTTKTRYYTSRNGPDSRIEVFDLRTNRTTTVRSIGDRGLPRGGAAIGWTPSNDLLYAMREPRPNQQDTNLWRQALDPVTAQPRGEPQRTTAGQDIAIQLSLSSDGKRAALRRHAPEPDIFIANIENSGKTVGPLKRLTLDERLDYAMAWSPDSQYVISYSNRDGPFHVFKQNIAATQAELLVGGKDDLYVPRMSPDGKSVLYIVRASAGGSSDNSRVMRVPLAGGPSQLVFEQPGLWDIQCSRLSSTLCLASTIQGSHQSFVTFDPLSGKRSDLKIGDADGDNFDWSLAPDGQHLAWAKNRSTQTQFGIRILSLTDGSKRDITVPGWVEIFGLDWTADSNGFFATAYDTKGVRALLHVGTDGQISTMLAERGADLYWAIPSPDGRRLALVKDSNSSNVSLLEKF